MVLEVNGGSVDGEDDLERLQQLAEAEPPLCLKLAARSLQGSEAGIPPESAEVGKQRQRGTGEVSRAGGLQNGAGGRDGWDFRPW